MSAVNAPLAVDAPVVIVKPSQRADHREPLASPADMPPSVDEIAARADLGPRDEVRKARLLASMRRHTVAGQFILPQDHRSFHLFPLSAPPHNRPGWRQAQCLAPRVHGGDWDEDAEPLGFVGMLGPGVWEWLTIDGASGFTGTAKRAAEKLLDSALADRSR